MASMEDGDLIVLSIERAALTEGFMVDDRSVEFYGVIDEVLERFRRWYFFQYGV